MAGETRGLRRRKIDGVFYFIVNLAELTRGTLLGEHLEEWVDEAAGIPRVREGWSWRELARWIFDMEQWAAEHITTEIERLQSYFLQEPLNSDPTLQAALRMDPVPSYLPDENSDNATYPQTPTVIAFREDEVPGGKFRNWFRRRALLSQPAAKTRTLFEELSEFREDWIVPVEQANARLEKDLIEPLIAQQRKLQVGEAVYTALFDFAAPKEVRATIWMRNGMPDNRAKYDFVVPEPDEERRSHMERERRAWSRDLMGKFAEVMTYANNASPRAEDRDRRARALLREMRARRGVIVRCLEHPDLLTSGDELKLRTTMVDAFAVLLKSPSVMKDLLESEIYAIARAAASSEAEPPEPATSEQAEVVHAIRGFRPESLFKEEKETPLSERLTELFTASNTALGRIPVVLDLLAVTAPLVHQKLLTKDPSGELSSAWLWRTLVGSLEERPVDVREAFWDHYWAIRKGALPKDADGSAQKLLDLKEGVIAAKIRKVTSSPGWRLLTVLVPLFSMASVLHEYKDKPALQAIATFQAAVDLVRDGTGLIENLYKSERMLRLFGVDSEHFRIVTHNLSESPALKVLGPLSGVLGFALSVDKYQRSTLKVSALGKDEESEALVFATIGLSLAFAEVAAPLALAGLVLYAGSQLFFSRYLWVLLHPDVDVPTAPHRYLAGLLRGIDDSQIIQDLRSGPPSRAMQEFDRLLEDRLSMLESGVDPNMPIYWDLGGEKGRRFSVAYYASHGLLRDYYGFDEKAINALVEFSSEV